MNKIDRRSFIKLASMLGVTVALPSLLTACDAEPETPVAPPVNSSAASSHTVLIIGAGAAGMSAAYLLTQQGIDCQILEAAPTYGGRIKRTDTFADFPIPLGAEWLHVEEGELQKIVNDDSVGVATEIVAYGPEAMAGYYEEGELYTEELTDSDLKFVDSTWFDFYDSYIVPSIADKMRFNTQITRVAYDETGVELTDQNGETYEATQLIVAVPLKILQDGDITFAPPLPSNKQEAIAEANIWGGIKVFLEFSEQFYPTALSLPENMTNTGQQLYYDAAYGQDTDKHILGLFAVGSKAEPYQALDPATAVRDYILAELDEVFNGRATKTYVKHIVQNWNEEPFIRAAYYADSADWLLPPVFSEPVDDKLFFAGTAFTNGHDWGGVHNAAQSARDAVELVLGYPVMSE